MPDRDADAPFAPRILHVESAASVSTASDGDLWPSAWADDGCLYAAAGDGTGFARHGWSDIVVNRIDGHPRTGLTGERLAAGRDVSPVWGDPAEFNCKPTGMVAVDGNFNGRDELYLAVQDLRCGDSPDVFNTAPTASIVRSDDYGRTWTATAVPMFTDGVFTTVMFLDLGRSNGGRTDWVYAYGLDGNWRTSHSRAVPDPDSLYLARVPPSAIQDRTAWEFVAGFREGDPVWSADIDARVPVLKDDRRVYPELPRQGGLHDSSPIAQGGIVWNAPLERYLYTSWTEYTFEFYEAPAPWGPWTLFLSKDFGTFPWTGPKSDHARHGGYAPTMPSKFISADGTEHWLQSNWFGWASTSGGRSYDFSLRRVVIDPGEDGVPPRPAEASGNLALDGTPLPTRFRGGRDSVLNDGDTDAADDSWNGVVNDTDAWGYAWRSARWMNRIVYTTGPQDSLGGWFAEGPTVEYRIDGTWRPARGTRVAPPYPNDFTALEHRRYVFDFDAVAADALRLVGRPGGWESYTSIAELEVYHTV